MVSPVARRSDKLGSRPSHQNEPQARPAAVAPAATKARCLFISSCSHTRGSDPRRAARAAARADDNFVDAEFSKQHMLRSSSLSCCIARRWLCSTGSSLVLRRSVPRQALPFAVSEAEARKSFKEWAADANGPSGSDEIELEAHAVPWWCFDITDPAAWPAERREWVYGGIEHDAVSLESAVSEALKHSGGAQEFEPDHPAWRHIRVEEEALTASIAWETVCAEQEGLDADTSLRAVALVNVPVWK